ncbi:MAG: stage II sporulation protein M [Gammaproteobacteria bacterium]|nr:stage II sporulation protein M [Gammaproteobacteria bacterium]
MTQDQFISAHEQQWLILEVLLNPALKPELIKRRKKRAGRKKQVVQSPYGEKIAALSPDLIRKADFPGLYREVCQHLSLAQSRRYSPYLIERLSFLIDQSHQVFYRHSHVYGESAIASLLTFFTRTFPQTVRMEVNWLWLSSAVFYLPLITMLVIIQIWPEFVYSVLPPDSVSSIESMYDPLAEHIGRERGSDSDSLMFGFYIFNNTSIGFRTFASGLIFGIGSLFTLMYNGLYIGSIAGHLTQVGYGTTFWSFVSGHSAMELTAIALSGAAGLKLGFSLLIPGRKSRYQAMLDAAKISVKIMAGAAVMFFIAAFFEAFWSSTQTIAVNVKYVVGIVMWLLVISYFAFVGRKTEQILSPSKEKKVSDES